MKIVVAGSNGFVGSHLVSYLKQEGHYVISLNRHPKGEEKFWDPAKGFLDPTQIEGTDVVINLAGESVFGRWSKKKKERIWKSRIESTHLLVETIEKLEKKPFLFMGASAVGYYGDRPQENLTETSPPGTGALAEICIAWEKASQKLTQKGIRVVSCRLGIILGNGGALKNIAKSYRLGCGVLMGSGNSYMSWIAIDDLCKSFYATICNEQLIGPINFVAPHSLTWKMFMQLVSAQFNKSFFFHIPSFILQFLLKEGAELFLSSEDVRPEKLLKAGYQFIFPEVGEVLKKYLPLISKAGSDNNKHSTNI